MTCVNLKKSYCYLKWILKKKNVFLNGIELFGTSYGYNEFYYTVV